MGILNFLFKKKPFVPDFNESEYDNYLNYIGEGGTEAGWKKLKVQNGWNFKESKTEIFMRYQKEVKPFSESYFAYLTLIEKNWSTMYQSKDYNGAMSTKIEIDCVTAIAYYKKMKEIDDKYGEKTPTNIPPFRRLAMLYERQNRYEDCIRICKEAYQYGMDETGRMKAALKKSGRTPTAEEAALIDK